MHEVLRVGRLDAGAEEGEAGRVVGVEEAVARRGQVLGQDGPQQALQLGGTEKKHGARKSAVFPKTQSKKDTVYSRSRL